MSRLESRVQAVLCQRRLKAGLQPTPQLLEMGLLKPHPSKETAMTYIAIRLRGLVLCGLSAGLFLLNVVALGQDKGADTKKAPVPDAKEQAKVKALLKDIYKDEFPDAAKSAEGKVQLANLLLKALETE